MRAFLQPEHHDEHEHEDHQEWCPPLDRRAALRLLGMTTIAAVAGCGTGGSVSSGSSTSSSTTATTTTLSASPAAVAQGATVVLTAAVSPSAASGTVTFRDGSTSLGTATLSSGSCLLNAGFSTAGSHSLIAVYAGNSTYATSTSSAVAVTVSATGAATCSATYEGEEGPYFVDDSAAAYNRSNIVSNLDGSNTQTGIPLILTVYVYDSKNSCAAMQGVQVDIWHCNANGVYSAEASESTTGQSWLRGYQISDATGMVQFATIIPGWYQGRTTHIHMRLRSTYNSSSTGGNNTMQVFFDQTLVDTIDTTVAPYSSEGKNTTTNAGDRVYTQQEQGSTLLTVAGSNSAGYAATAKIYLPIS